jgi:hypothetical protein
VRVSSKKQKGRRFQQEIGRRIAILFGLKYGENGDVESRGMGQAGTDVRLSPEAIRVFPFSIECKNQERWEIHDWIKQAKTNQIEGTDWLLFAKRNHMSPVVVMDAEAFWRLIKETRD